MPELRSIRISDLFEIYREKFGLSYTAGERRISEKLHEQMIAYAETDRVTFDEEAGMYSIHYQKVSGAVRLPLEGYSSELHLMSKQELDELLQKHNYYQGSSFM